MPKNLKQRNQIYELCMIEFSSIKLTRIRARMKYKLKRRKRNRLLRSREITKTKKVNLKWSDPSVVINVIEKSKA